MATGAGRWRRCRCRAGKPGDGIGIAVVGIIDGRDGELRVAGIGRPIRIKPLSISSL